ncbi:SUN domain-containing protein 1-like [Thalassophryne amazonica]|uniref:SUN domain-containing protein 1-like n=1 Tax=Thalassophryne amazonica TaxID=390379 RepID=UPI0014715E67|nr:SUN domain-containing protein 1-like [Thalassophryne amazonica]
MLRRSSRLCALGYYRADGSPTVTYSESKFHKVKVKPLVFPAENDSQPCSDNEEIRDQPNMNVQNKATDTSNNGTAVDTPPENTVAVVMAGAPTKRRDGSDSIWNVYAMMGCTFVFLSFLSLGVIQCRQIKMQIGDTQRDLLPVKELLKVFPSGTAKELQQELVSVKEHLTNSVKKLQQELESVEERHTNSVKKLQQELESGEERHTNSVKKLQQELESGEERHTNSVKKLQQELESGEESHTNVMKKLQQELESGEESHTNSVKKLQQQRESVEERHTNSVKELQQELTSVKEHHTNSMKKLQQELESVEERHTNSVKELQQELESVEERHTNSMKKLQQELASVEERHTNSVKELQQELESVTNCLVFLVEKLQEEFQATKKLVKAVAPVADSMPNFALESQGARVLHHRSSATLGPQSHKRMWEMFQNHWDPHTKQQHVIEGKSSLYPGDCWAFAGEVGHLFIALSHPVHITHVTLGHITRSQSLIGDIPSAPRQFSIYGMRTQDEKGTHLGRFVYDRNGESFQTFDLPEPSKDHIIRYVKLQIEENWGNIDFTCLYDFRVHGKLKKTHNARRTISSSTTQSAAHGVVEVSMRRDCRHGCNIPSYLLYI